MKIKKDDNVLVIAGKDKGKKGKVRFVYPKDRLLLKASILSRRTAKRKHRLNRQELLNGKLRLIYRT
jgi:large subunit ribosomal protein L24